MHSSEASVSLFRPLPFIIFTLFAKLVHPYETYDLTDQIAEESSPVQSVVDLYGIKEVNSSFGQNHLDQDWPSKNVVHTTEIPLAIKPGTTSKISPSSDPLNSILPRIKFSCKNKSEAYYSDLDFCDIFHYCKSNGYRFTFLCPNDSFYNNQLMACEQNATHLKYCKEKASNLEVATLAEVTTKHPTSTEKPTLSKLVSLPEPDMQSLDSAMSVSFESTRMSTPFLTQIETGSTPSSDSTLTGTLSTLSKAAIEEDPLSTTTLIPPSLFIEPTMPNIVALEDTAQLNHILSLAYSDTLPTVTSSNPTLRPDSEPTTLSSNLKLQVPESPQTSGLKNEYQSSKTDNQNLSFSSTIDTGKWQLKTNQMTTNKPESTGLADSKLFNMNQILSDLDMSTFELSTEKSHPSYSNSVRKRNHHHSNNGYAQVEDTMQKAPQHKSGPDGAKFSLSLHKFFKEGFPTQYWKSVPKLFRSLNAMRDYEASLYGSNSQITPRKNDHSSGVTNQEDGSHTASMLSIPVLVPVNLSQDDYRRRMSASVLKPIVIPLREKGKLIPAYVLQFSSKWRSRHKRSALNGKRLLSLSIKPNLLYQVIFSLLKIKSIKPIAPPNSAIKSRVKPTPNYDLLMSAQNMLPMYSMPNGEMFPANQLAHLFKHGNPYDLSDYNQFIPPFYFVEQQPYHYRPPTSKSRPINKRPPLRSKIPGLSVLNATYSNQTIPSSTVATGMMAVGSSLNGQKVSTPATPLFNSLGSTHMPTYLDNYTPHVYGNSYYSPLLYFGNSFDGSEPDSSRFMPLLKKASFLKKLRPKNAFNQKEDKQPEPAPNITMPANIYVPDDILEDFPMESVTASSNVTTNNVDHKQIDHKISNDLMESFNSDESSPVEMFARSNQSSLFAYRQNRAMSNRGHKGRVGLRHGELTAQAQINANFFNGTALKSNKSIGVDTSKDASNGHQHGKQEQNANYTGQSSNAYQHVAQSRPSSEPHWVTGKYEHDTAESALNLTSYLRHLKTHPDSE